MEKQIVSELVESKIEELIESRDFLQKYEKRGYLEDDYKMFYLKDCAKKEYPEHYHEFDKILLFLKGNVRYTIEGKTYDLMPNDIVLVKRGDIHKVEIDGKEEYERMVIYISPQYLTRFSKEGTPGLNACFDKTKENNSNVVRTAKMTQTSVYKTMMQLKRSFEEECADELEPLYRETLFLQFMIQLNRAIQKEDNLYADTDHCNPKIVKILRYINAHLTEELSINHIAETFYLSRYHMMRQFKQETGYTIGTYISQKRLLYARELLREGASVTKACYESGFKEHSTFTRAYKQLFGVTPAKSREENG